MPRPACGWRPRCPAPSHVIDQGSLDDDPSCSNAGTVPRCAVSLSVPWRAARRPEHKAVARARCRLRVLPISWGPSVVSTCAGDVSGRAAHVCTRGRQSHCRQVTLEHSPAARLGARRPAVAGRAAPAAHSPHRAKWRHPGPRPQEAQPVGGRRQEAPGPARPTAGPGRSRHEAAGLLPPPSSEGVGDQPHSAEQGPAAQTGRPGDRRSAAGPRSPAGAEGRGPHAPCSPAPWSSPPAWRSAPCSGSRARGRQTSPRVSASGEKFPAASGSGCVFQF